MLCTCCRYTVWPVTVGGQPQTPCPRCAQPCTNSGCGILRPNPNGVYGRFRRVDNVWNRLLGRLGRGPSVGS